MVPLKIDLDGNKLQLEENGVWEIQETEAVRLRWVGGGWEGEGRDL